LNPEISKVPVGGLTMLNTTPVGVPSFPSGSPPGAGMDTTKDCFAPLELYNVNTPAPLSDTQNGEVEDVVRHHGFSSCGSTVGFALLTGCTMPLLSFSGFALTTRSVSTKPPARLTSVVLSMEVLSTATHAAHLVKERITPPYRSYSIHRPGRFA